MDYEKLRSLLPKVHTKWTTDDVLVWLQFIGLESLFPIFSINLLMQRMQRLMAAVLLVSPKTT
jgi:predicted acyltransferase